MPIPRRYKWEIKRRMPGERVAWARHGNFWLAKRAFMAMIEGSCRDQFREPETESLKQIATVALLPRTQTYQLVIGQETLEYRKREIY